MLEMHQCEDCFMSFDNPQALNSHKEKFCIHSKYADIDSLTKQYDQIKGNQNIKKSYFRPPSEHLSLKSSQQSHVPYDHDKEYRELLRQIGDREDLRNKLEREKLSAQQQLDVLQKKEKDLFLNARKRDLQEVIKNRQKIINEEEQLQREIKQFEKQKKEESRVRHMKVDEDFAFREGREAGKLAMQRRLLEQKKREIQNNLKLKKREEEKLNIQLDKISDEPIFVPEYRKKESVVKKPTNEIRQQTLPSDFSSSPKPYRKPETPVPKKPYTESIINPVNLEASKKSIKSEINDDYLKAALFSGKQKTLFESLNPKGKSDEDIFIQSLVAQQYDALNILARLPKDSELYAVKMKQFQEMSRIRQELKDKIQKVRFDKVRREFEMEKNMTETQKANVEWLDKNRKHMLNREVDILQNQARLNQLENQNVPYANSMLPSDTPEIRRLQQTSQLPGTIRQQSRPPEFPSIDNIPQGRLTTQQGQRGYKITVKALRGYTNRAAMCVKVVVLEDDSQNGHWTFSTKYHDEAAPKDDRNPYNPTVKNRLDDMGAVVFNQSFEIRQDLQSRYNNNQNEMYLWIMVMEKDDLKVTNQPQLYIWYCFKLTHFGHIREGAFNLALYHDNFTFPNPTDMNRLKSKANEEILIQLSQCQLSQEKKPQTNINNQRNRTGRNPQTTGTQGPQDLENNIPNKTQPSKTGRKTMLPRPSDPKINSLKNINQDFFIENQKPSDFQNVKGRDKISFTFSIGELRTLPSYLGPLKIQVRFIDHQNYDVLPTEEFLAEFGDDMYNPKVKFLKEVVNQQIPSSTVIVIRLIAISTLSYEPGLVGSCYFHLGYNEEGIGLETEQSTFYLINGLYQLPIYWGNIESYLTVNQLINDYPSIPCSSILISFREGNERETSLPNYSSGVYNTIFFSVDEIQYRLFREQAKRERQKTLDYVQGYYKFKGVSIVDYSQNDLKKLLSQTLAFNHENTTNIFMLESMAQYNNAFGMRVYIDEMKIPPGQTNYYYFTTVCLFPPAKYYSEDKCDLDFLYKINLSSSSTELLILNQDPLLYYPPYDPNTCLIIELNRIQLSQTGVPESRVETSAFTVIPLFDLQVSIPCANIGFKEVFLKEGEFDKRQLQNLQQNSIRYIELMQGQKKSEFGVVVRVLNGFFPKQLMALNGGGKGKPLRSIFQNSKGFKSAVEGAKKIIEDTYGISLS